MTAGPVIDYEVLTQEAMRGLVRTVLGRIVKSGLPGDHHFYIAFDTRAPGVALSRRLKEKYPDEMTIVLQHRFWDLAVTDERFEVKLTFDGIPERLVVPFAAIKVFFDPSVPYGLQFEEAEATSAATRELGSARAEASEAAAKEPATGRNGAAARPERKPRAPRKMQADKAEGGAEAAAPKRSGKGPSALPKPEEHAAQPSTEAKVVSIDAFRKK